MRPAHLTLQMVLISSLLLLSSLSMASIPSMSLFSDPPPGNWFVKGSLGAENLVIDSRYTVNNGSGYSPPSNVDSYSTHINTTAEWAVDGGYRWKRDQSWIPAYSLGLHYSHSFAEDVGDKIMQYSLPDYTNYNYQWDIYSNIFMLLAKINLFDWRHIQPYVTAGGGIAFNSASDYKEIALSGISARDSAGFASNTKSQAAYSLGIGIDYTVKPTLIMSLGYEYQNLGRVSSGSGASTWAGTYLRSGTYQTNTLLLGVTWLI